MAGLSLLSMSVWGVLYLLVIGRHAIGEDWTRGHPPLIAMLPMILGVTTIVVFTAGLIAWPLFAFCLRERNLKNAMWFLQLLVGATIVLLGITTYRGNENAFYGAAVVLVLGLAFVRFSGLRLFIRRERRRLVGETPATVGNLAAAIAFGAIATILSIVGLGVMVDFATTRMTGTLGPFGEMWDETVIVAISLLAAFVGASIAAAIAKDRAMVAVSVVGGLFLAWIGSITLAAIAYDGVVIGRQMLHPVAILLGATAGLVVQIQMRRRRQRREAV